MQVQSTKEWKTFVKIELDYSGKKTEEMIDYLIVGAGLYGSVFAHEVTKRGYSCLVIDRRNHLGGNIYCSQKEGINVHEYGAHIFHTSNKSIWEYMQQFAEFNNYINSPLANYKGELYNLPFNMNTFYQLWKVKTPAEAMAKIESQIKNLSIDDPKNLEEQALKLVGPDIYEKLIKEYTEKQWGTPCHTLPAFIIKRLPVRFTYNNNYFNDTYQGIPIGGYNKIIEGLLHGVETRLNVDFLSNREEFQKKAKKIVYTGGIDEYYDYELGELEYRTLSFEHEVLDMKDFQGNAVVNYTDKATPYTRIIEHKHFEFGTQEKTIITKEYSTKWKRGMDCYYPINDDRNTKLYKEYRLRAERDGNVIFGGRLGEYKYLDMHQVVASALKEIQKEFSL